jgi:hypothetical protein
MNFRAPSLIMRIGYWLPRIKTPSTALVTQANTEGLTLMGRDG